MTRLERRMGGLLLVGLWIGLVPEAEALKWPKRMRVVSALPAAIGLVPKKDAHGQLVLPGTNFGDRLNENPLTGSGSHQGSELHIPSQEVTPNGGLEVTHATQPHSELFGSAHQVDADTGMNVAGSDGMKQGMDLLTGIVDPKNQPVPNLTGPDPNALMANSAINDVFSKLGVQNTAEPTQQVPHNIGQGLPHSMGSFDLYNTLFGWYQPGTLENGAVVTKDFIANLAHGGAGLLQHEPTFVLGGVATLGMLIIALGLKAGKLHFWSDVVVAPNKAVGTGLYKGGKFATKGGIKGGQKFRGWIKRQRNQRSDPFSAGGVNPDFGSEETPAE